MPWTTYAVLQTTYTAWSLMWDPLIVYAWLQASSVWSPQSRSIVVWSVCLFIFGFTKTVKLWGHYIRYPADIKMHALYVSFGYVHCLLKAWGLFTLSTVSNQSNSNDDHFPLTAFSDGMGKQGRCGYGQQPPHDPPSAIRRAAIRRSRVRNFRHASRHRRGAIAGLRANRKRPGR